MTQAWSIPLPHAEKIVLLALSDNANDEGLCWPSVTTLKNKCGMDERTIQRVITRLADAGHVTVNVRPGRSNYYTVHPGTPGAPPPRHNASPADDRSGAEPGNPRHSAAPPPAQSHPTPGAAPPRTNIEPSGEPSVNRLVRAKRSPDTAKRLPADFELTEQRRQVATAERVDADREFANFRDHWSAASGARARKHDWDAAWRIWCRKSADMSDRQPPRGRPAEARATAEANELQALKDRRAEMGLAGFRDPYPHESPAAYRTAQRLALQDRAPARTGAKSVKELLS